MHAFRAQAGIRDGSVLHLLLNDDPYRGKPLFIKTLRCLPACCTRADKHKNTHKHTHKHTWSLAARLFALWTVVGLCLLTWLLLV
jgi:hypothetical protein